ncbi:MAG: hypothetical protein WCY91_07190 [Acidithiobacillus sp.]|uniref:hypothetical protein n=1 Tax=Acidithiobacillus sp. TaxID=1872118 RepID=UPI00355CDBF2
MSTLPKSPQPPRRTPALRDLATDILRRHGLPQASNVALLPDRHPQYRHCERHGRYPESLVDEQGTVRFITPAGCPRCRAERQLAALLDRAAIPERYRDCDSPTSGYPPRRRPGWWRPVGPMPPISRPTPTDAP